MLTCYNDKVFLFHKYESSLIIANRTTRVTAVKCDNIIKYLILFYGSVHIIILYNNFT